MQLIFALQSCRGTSTLPYGAKQDGHSMNMLPLRLVYSEKATLPIGRHVFHAGKYRGMRERLLQAGAFTESDFISAPPCEDEDVLLVHTQLWVEKLKHGTLSTREELELEVPYSKELVEAFWHMAGGSIVAARAGAAQSLLRPHWRRLPPCLRRSRGRLLPDQRRGGCHPLHAARRPHSRAPW